MATRVKISLFKPTGFIDTHFVDTDDRGSAIRRTMEKYTDKELAFVNFISADLCEMPKEEVSE